MRLGYNTNGLAHHRLTDALPLLARLGYRGVALTPDVGALDLYNLRSDEVRTVRELARELDLLLVVETGSRFLLDPNNKHRPSLLEDSPAARNRRVDFLRRSIDLSAALGSAKVSIWAGLGPHGEIGDGASPAAEDLWDRLVAGLLLALDHARERSIRLCFEPEPGMFIERPAGYLELLRRLGDRGQELGLTLDVGHLLVTGDLPVEDQIQRLSRHLEHCHLDDIRGGVHEHRPFGEGDLDLPKTLRALISIGYGGMAAVELSRDSHRGAWMAAEAMRRIQAALP